MPSDFASQLNEHEESAVVDVHSFIEKIREYEQIIAKKRALEFNRIFYNLESLRNELKRRTVAKGCTEFSL